MVFSWRIVFCICFRWYTAWIILFKREWGSWYSAAAEYSASVCDGMQHESGYLGQSGDHGIQLQHIIMHLLAMACSMNQVIKDRVGTIVFSCSIVLCLCLRWHAKWIRLFRIVCGLWYSAAAEYSASVCDSMQQESSYLGQSGDHGIQMQHIILHLVAMACNMNQVI